jgi:hypothetical protein
VLRWLAIPLFLLLAAAPDAVAKDQIESVVVCGQSRCEEISGPAVAAAASTITYRSRLPLRRPAPFYEVMLVLRLPDGARSAGTALRYVPSARAVASWGPGLSDELMWFRTDRALTALLTDATRGLQPQSAAELNRPREAISGAALSAREKVTSPISAAPSTTPPTADDDQLPTGLLLPGLLAATLGAIGLVLLRRSRRSSSTC